MKFCKRCNAETERYKNGQCKLCKKSWLAANLEKMKAYYAAYRADNKEKVNAAIASWGAKNPEKLKARTVAYRAANKEKMNAATAIWRASNPEKLKEYSAAWRALNPEKVRVRHANRRALKLGNGGKHTAADIRNLLDLQKSKCACCKTSIKDGYHIDHIIALSNGGSNDKLNLQLLCPPCNLSKNSKHPIEFMQSRGFLL